MKSPAKMVLKAKRGLNVNVNDLAKMSSDELWLLRGTIRPVLSKRLKAEIKLQELRLASLNELIRKAESYNKTS